MRAAHAYATPMELGQVIVGGVVGRIIRSRTPAFSEGEIVEGSLGWQEYAVSDGSNLRRVDLGLGPLSTALGVLGMPGMTAYFGFLEVGQPRTGDTVVVSAASGAVGQISKIMGCRTIGVAGSPAKIDYIVNELGFDAGINYKTESVAGALGASCPLGIDVYFDNVGGDVTDAVFDHLNLGARLSLCGSISQYNQDEPEPGPRKMGLLVGRQAKAEGFLVSQFRDRHDEGRRRIAAWMKEGKIKYREDVVEGLENAPRAFIGLMQGENFGKLLIKVSEG
jgi:NADPH-dependent curcumin reductase CurA